MCSVQDGGAALMKKELAQSVSGNCMKCAAPAVAVARTKDPFCKSCLHGYFVHRFRSTFGKSKLVTSGERVLLAFSGGASSSVLLTLSEEGLSHQVHKKLRFVPTIIFIDDGAILGLDYGERCQILAAVLDLAMHSGFPVFFTQLEQVYGSFEVYNVEQLLEVHTLSPPPNPVSMETVEDILEKPYSAPDVCTTFETEQMKVQSSNSDPGDVGAEPKSKHIGAVTEKDFQRRVLEFMEEKRSTVLESKLQEVFACTITHTAKENLLLSLRQQLLSDIATKGGFRKVLLGSNATGLAVRLLSNVAQGRGATLPLDVGFADNRSNEVMFLRPLREFPSKEIATFVALHNLHTITIPTLTSLAPDKSSIDRLTGSFVCGLQQDFPSTINTVFRTGDKLAVGEGGFNESLSACLLCQAPPTREADESVFSHLSCPPDSEPNIRGIWSQLCYGCRLTVKDMKGCGKFLPTPIRTLRPELEAKSDSLHSATAGANQMAMKAQIKEFLLEDS